MMKSPATTTFYELHNAPEQIAEETESPLEDLHHPPLWHDTTGSSINESITSLLTLEMQCT